MRTHTIAAIATPQGRGGIGVIRLSGPQAVEIAQLLTEDDIPKARVATYRRFVDADEQTIDEGIVLYFPAPHSFTGEDVVELQGHGGPMVQAALLARVYALGASAAEPGEFSARAFYNNKMDLAQAEAIADLIDANSQAAAKSAVRSLQGVFSAHINDVLTQLIQLRLHVEAAIDFPEEEIDFLADGKILTLLLNVQAAVARVQASAKQGQLLREGLQVVIAGRPNVGKSSLLNALAGINRAIVTEVAGTTRDVLQEKMTLNGLPITLIDTAGLRDTQDIVEQEGIRRAHQEIEHADLLLLVYDVSQNDDPIALGQDFFKQSMQPERVILVGNKADLTVKDTAKQGAETTTKIVGYRQVAISAKYKDNIKALVDAICQHANFHPEEDTFIARTRHLDAMLRCQLFLTQAKEELEVYKAGELVAESLRLAQNALAEITGAFSADDLLGEIFSSFCIGK